MIELKFPLQLDSYGAFATTSSYSEIWKQRVSAALSTLKGTRVMRPEYGITVDNVLFMNSMGSVDTVSGMVEDVFRTDLPELRLVKIEEFSDSSSGALTVNVQFALPNKQSVETKISINADSLSGGN